MARESLDIDMKYNRYKIDKNYSSVAVFRNVLAAVLRNS